VENLPVSPEKRVQNLSAVFAILLVLKYLLIYLAGKANTESVKNLKLFYTPGLETDIYNPVENQIFVQVAV